MTETRRAVTENEFPLRVACPVCGIPYLLHFNGGELDRRSCHGVTWAARATGYELVVIDERHEDRR